MANLKKFIGFAIQWIGDGSNSQVVVDFVNDPISFQPPSGDFLSPVFNVTSNLPNAVGNVAVGGATLSSATYNSVTGKLTVIFTSAPTNGAVGNITGYAEYN